METEIIGLIGVGFLMVLLAGGMPVAFAAALTGFLGICVLGGISPALSTAGTVPFTKISFYAFTVVPLFILLGYFAFGAGMATQAFEVGKQWLGHIPGGLPLATVFGCAFFAACSGVTVASAAVFGKLAIPEMEKLGYKSRLAAGVVAASGTFACMIPPSGIMVVYAIMAGTSVGRQLIAGLLPGLLTALFYGAMLFVRVKRDPSLTGKILPRVAWRERLSSIPKLWGISVVALVIIGGIYLGIFTPTEAGAIGAFTTCLLFLIKTKGAARRSGFIVVLLDTGRTTGLIVAIFFGIVIFANFLALSRVTYSIIEGIGALEVNRYVILIGIMGFYMVLGMFFEAMGMLMLSIPLVLPIILALGFDPIWFGVLAVKTIEIGLVTPPVGLTTYVVKGVAPHIPLEEIFRGILPFILMDIVVLGLMVAFPQIVMFLPNMMVR